MIKIISGEIQPSIGQIYIEAEPYYIPQIFGQFNHFTIGQVLRVEDKLNALKGILNGNTSKENFDLLNEDWTIEDRCREALNYWQLDDLDLSQKMETLSGGQKNKDLFSRNFYSSTRISFIGRAKQSFGYFGPTAFI